MSGPIARSLARMRDVTLALRMSDTSGTDMGRLQLQKFLYLTDAIAYLYEILPPVEGHQTYLRGPYDSAIQNAVDCLVFRGFVRAADVRNSAAGQIFANYSLTSAGLAWSALLAEHPLFRNRWLATVEVGKHVNAIGWNRLRDLAYAEPTFVARRQQGYGQRLHLEAASGGSTAQMINLIKVILTRQWRHGEISREIVVRLFFEYLVRYSESVRGGNFVSSEDIDAPEALTMERDLQEQLR